MEDDIRDALEVAAGTRLKSGRIDDPRTPTAHDLAATRRVVRLFLESLDADLTVSELRQFLS